MERNPLLPRIDIVKILADHLAYMEFLTSAYKQGVRHSRETSKDH